MRWITSEFYIPETGAPITLHPSQARPLTEALRIDADGKFIYSTVLWSAIKKSAKSSIAAAVGMWFAWRKPGSSIKVLGNDLNQAQSRVYEYMRRAVMLRPDWRSTVKINLYKMTLPNGSTIEAIPIDPTGEAGGNDDCVIYTELWGWRSGKQQQMWTESTLSPTKYGQSIRWCESYAGFSGQSPVLETLYQSGVKGGRVIDADYECYANDAARLFVLWNTRPQLSWQTPDYYAQESATLTPGEFSRIHRNQWGTSNDAFIPIDWWDACNTGALPALADAQSVVVGIDAAVSNDNFAIVAVSRHGERVIVRDAKVFVPPAGGKLRFSNPDDPADLSTPEGHCRALAKRFNVVCWCFDPYQLIDFTQRLRGELGWFYEFNQGGPRALADKQLYDMIRERRVQHDGTLDMLRLHIANADRTAEGDAKLRLIKRAEHMKIDAAVALSMATAQAMHLNISLE